MRFDHARVVSEKLVCEVFPAGTPEAIVTRKNARDQEGNVANEGRGAHYSSRTRLIAVRGSNTGRDDRSTLPARELLVRTEASSQKGAT